MSDRQLLVNMHEGHEAVCYMSVQQLRQVLTEQGLVQQKVEGLLDWAKGMRSTQCS